MNAAAVDADLSPVKRALLEIRELRARLAAAESAAREPIAIVGAAMRLPGGVRDLDALWSLLCSGRDAIVDVPADRWDVDAVFGDVDEPGKTTTRRGGFIDGVDEFDAEFFGISPREAESMDPQQRLTLQASWHALEHAGIAPTSLRGSRTGVFVGVSNNDYGRMLFAHRDRIDPTFSVGNAASVVAGRVSYFLGLQGPSLAIDTACSSSLVALHLAVQSLRSGECDLALAGGVNLILSPEIDINFSKAGMMAADGRCKTFDAAADGYVRGEGCGVLVLRRLRDAGESRVMALVRGSAVNQDGRSAGLTAPNGPAQQTVIRAAVAAAGIVPRDIGYVEAHGTGTPLGDPIELQAIASALGEGRADAATVAVGSIKTQIGHLEAAAGVAGVLKAVLALQHGEIPPHLNLHEPNPHVDWPTLGVVVPTSRTPWPALGGRRLAGVSSFGFSGTNAHVVLEAAPAAARPDAGADSRTLHVLPLSARDGSALAELAARYAERLDETLASTADVCATAACGRSHFAHRVSVRGSSCGELAESLRDFAAGGVARRTVAGTAGRPRVAFLFTGGGAQSPGMALGLAARSNVFRDALARCAQVLDPLLGYPLLDVLAGVGAAPLDRARYGQPALVAVEIALAALWRSWGIEPDAVLGHSLGEYAAAHVAGLLELDDALRIVVERTRHVEAVSARGAMATVFAAPADVEATIEKHGGVNIAAYNGPSQVVVSGAADALGALCAVFESRGTRVSRLRVDYASHSALMDPVLPAFEASLAGLRAGEPRIEFVSNLTGAPAGRAVVEAPSYWARHLRQPVRFAQSLQHLHDSGCTHYVEIGPHPVLTAIGADCLPAAAGVWLPSLRRGYDDWDTILESLQTLYADGATVDWGGVHESAARRPVELPVYPFRARHHWADWAREPAAVRAASDDAGASAWSAVARALDSQAERGPIGVDLSGYAAKWASLERLATAHAVRVLRGAGIFSTAGEQANAEAVRRRLGAAEHYRHLVGRWLQRLADAGQLRAVGDATYAADRPLAESDLAAHWHDARSRLADNAALLDYVRHCGALLPSVLRGDESPLETLFPGGRYDIADGLYRRSSTMRYINSLAASAVQAFVDARGARSLRALEIGAGSGATTAALLPCFVPQRTIYRYTDVSPFFFERAREEHAGRPWVEFGEFDLDAEVPDDAPCHDLVVAANAVHACRDLRAALRRLRRLVAPGGMLLLVESTVHLAWFDITTGLIEGWQHFADDLRKEQPLIDAPTWLAALHDAGFDAAEAWPREGSPASELGQHVIVARVAGTVLDAAVSASPVDVRLPERAPRPAAAPVQWRQRVEAALPAERLDAMREYVRACVMRVLKLDESAPPQRDQRLTDLGFDSLMAVQLRNALGTGLQLGKALPATVMFDHPTIEALATFLLERIELAAPPAAVAASSAPAPAPAVLDLRAVAALSDADIEALLLSRMETR